MYHKFEKVTDAAKDKYKIGSTVCVIMQMYEIVFGNTSANI